MKLTIQFSFQPDRDSDEFSTDVENESDAGDSEDENANKNEIPENLCDNTQDKHETSLKHLTKTRSFIRFIIQVYRQQISLWDTTPCGRYPEKLQCLNAIAHEINKKFNINATAKEVDMIIKRLRRRFIIQYNLNMRWTDVDRDHSTTPLWFYEELKFIEPHIKCSKQVSKHTNLLILVKNSHILQAEDKHLR